MPNQNSNFVINSVTITDPVKLRVQLTYTLNGCPASGNVVEIDGQGTAVISYVSGAAGWTVYGCKVNGNQPHDMTIQMGGEAGQPCLNIIDTPVGTGTEALNFYLQVKNAQGTVYTSQDPAVVNEPA